jgi:Neuraminidase (sialidase)
VCACLSDDGGQTWGPPIVLRDDGGNHDLGYPRVVQRRDGAIVTAYYFNEQAEGERFIGATIWRA